MISTIEALNKVTGVQIQEGSRLCSEADSYPGMYRWKFSSEVLSELLRSQESAYNVRDSIRQHHLARAKICSKLIKYPHIEDYTVRRQSFRLDLCV